MASESNISVDMNASVFEVEIESKQHGCHSLEELLGKLARQDMLSRTESVSIILGVEVNRQPKFIETIHSHYLYLKQLSLRE